MKRIRGLSLVFIYPSVNYKLYMDDIRKTFDAYLDAQDKFRKARFKMTSHWPEMIRRALKRNRCSLRTLATTMGVSATYLSMVRTGRQEMSPGSAEILARHL